ncbi:oligosaccharide repeat unit polymerase Wzy [Bacillus sp. JCM 19045]|nr:oligosaccharide repeat unit polymerase Wzy [Bacillus sp. JCM 19045]
MQSHDYRFGLKSVAFGFGHPSEFALFLILLSIFNLYFNAKYRMRIDYLFLFLNFILLLFSGRVTALSFFALLCIILISFRFFRNYVAMGVTVSLIIAIGFAYDKIHETFIALEHARGVLLNSANLIAQDYFPFGSGLGTFGSHASRVNYSELYYSYGVSNFYGLSEDYPAFITDSYWAMMIAENGYIASIMQFLAIVILISSLYIRNKSIITIIVIYPLIYMLFTTPIDTIMLSNSSLPLVFTAAVLVSIEFKNNCKVSLKRK